MQGIEEKICDCMTRGLYDLLIAGEIFCAIMTSFVVSISSNAIVM